MITFYPIFYPQSKKKEIQKLFILIQNTQNQISFMILQNSSKLISPSWFLSANSIIADIYESLTFSPKFQNICFNSINPIVFLSGGKKNQNSLLNSSSLQSVSMSSFFKNSMNSSCSTQPPPSASISLMRSSAQHSFISISQTLSTLMIQCLLTPPELSRSNSIKILRYSSFFRFYLPFLLFAILYKVCILELSLELEFENKATEFNLFNI